MGFYFVVIFKLFIWGRYERFRGSNFMLGETAGK